MSDSMLDTMPVEDYLAQGGVLTSPANVPNRYRGELMRLMGSFVDSELAGSAGFADTINFAPGIKERIAASRITLEKADHAERVLDIMSSFGTNKDRYQTHQNWAARVDREADVPSTRQGGDMRLSVFHYPLQGWTDAVVMNALMGLATKVQLGDMSRVSYGPLAEVFREIAPQETRHMELGFEGLGKIVERDEGVEEARQCLAYWRPKVAATFGAAQSERFDTLKKFGLRHTENEALKADWTKQLDDRLAALNLN